MEKVNKVNTLFRTCFFFFFLNIHVVSNGDSPSRMTLKTHTLVFFPDSAYSFFHALPSSGEVEDPDYDDCMACEEGCRKCVLCKSRLSGQKEHCPQRSELSSQRVADHVQEFLLVVPVESRAELFCLLSTDNPRHCLSCTEGFYK